MGYARRKQARGGALARPKTSGYRLTFGKHRGEAIGEVAASKGGAAYLEWLLAQGWLREDARGAITDFFVRTRRWG